MEPFSPCMSTTACQCPDRGIGIWAGDFAAGNVDRAVELFIPNALKALADPEYQARIGHIVELALERIGFDLAIRQAEKAAILLGAIDRLVAEGGYLEHPKTHSRYREAIEKQLDPATLEKVVVQGRALTLEQIRSLITEPIKPHHLRAPNGT